MVQKINMFREKRTLLWNEDFSHRPSWCDANLALQQIEKGRATGNIWALHLRAGLQKLLFNLGCFIQSHHSHFVFLGTIILCLFCLGLQHTRIEVDIDKLWVEKGGRLDEERQFIQQTFSSISSSINTNDRPNLIPQNQQDNSNSFGQAQYLVLIQTLAANSLFPKNILNRKDLLLHAQVLNDVAQMSIEMFGEKWTLSDICFKPDPPRIEGDMADLFQNLVDKIVPCIIITPLDCFWEGSIALGPFPPVELPDSLALFINSLSKRLTWKVLDPLSVVLDLLEYVHLTELESLKSLFQRAGVEHGYLRRPCIDPLNPECPPTAPNFIDLCPVVEKFVHWNEEEGNIFQLRDQMMIKNANSASFNKKQPIITTSTHFITTKTAQNLSSTVATVKVLDVFGVLESSDNNEGSNEDDFDSFDHLYNRDGEPRSESQLCRSNKDQVRTILKSDKKLMMKFLPEYFGSLNHSTILQSSERHRDFSSEFTGGCSGFAQNFMHWPEDLIIGGVQRDRNRVVKAEALQTILMITSAPDLYQRIKFGDRKNINRYDWTVEAAEQVLQMWQRNFTQFIYNHVNNSQQETPPIDKNGANNRKFGLKLDENEILSKKDHKRQLHALAGTSINDMMTEFSRFNPTLIVVGYAVMIIYASFSMVSCTSNLPGGCCVQSSVGLAISGCLLVTLSSLAGLGFSMAAGLTFNVATTQIVPFLALGLGVDDLFLLVHNYVSVVKVVDRHEIGLLLKETGLSALLTSVNNILAFLAGAMLPIPALRTFCFQIALLLSFNSITILTIFPAMLSVDLLRRKNRRLDMFCCFKRNCKLKSIDGSPKTTNTNCSFTSSTSSSPDSQKSFQKNLTVSSPIEGQSEECKKKSLASENCRSSADSGYSLSCCSCCPKTPTLNNNNINSQNEPLIINTNCPKSRKPSPIDSLIDFEHCDQDSMEKIDNTTQKHLNNNDCCFRSMILPSNWSLQNFVENFYAKWMRKTPVKVFILLTHMCLLSLGIIGCSHIKLGLELTDVLPKNTAPFAFLDARQAYFSFYPFNAILRGPIDVSRRQTLLKSYREAVQRVPWVVKPTVTSLGDRFWLQLMSEWLVDLQKKFDKDFEAVLISRNGISANATLQPSFEAILAYKLLCNAGDELRRSRVGNTRLVDKDGIINPDGFYNYLTAWYNADPMTYYVSQANLHPLPPHWWPDDKLEPDKIKIPPAPIPVYSQIPFFVSDLVDTTSIIDMITQVRAVSDHYAQLGLDTFPEGIPFTFWEQYLHLKWNLTVALSIVLAAVFVVITFLLMSPWTAAVMVLMLIVLIVELAGFMGVVGVKLNAVSSVSLITAVGMGVEFTGHVSLSFLTALGSNNQRVAATLGHMAVPVFHGGLSTLLGVVMLGFSEFDFVIRYFFMVLSALVVLGLFNGLCVLPVLLSIVGPRSEVRPIDGSDHLNPPTPPPSPIPPEMVFADNFDSGPKMMAKSNGTNGPLYTKSNGVVANGNNYHRHSDSLSTIVEEQESPPSSATPSSMVKIEGPRLVFHPRSNNCKMVNSPVNVTSNTKVNLQLQITDKFADALVDKCSRLFSAAGGANLNSNSANLTTPVNSNISGKENGKKSSENFEQISMKNAKETTQSAGITTTTNFVNGTVTNNVTERKRKRRRVVKRPLASTSSDTSDTSESSDDNSSKETEDDGKEGKVLRQKKLSGGLQTIQIA